MIVKDNIQDFHPDHIFDCGQCFRWDKETDGSYTGIAEGSPPVNIAFFPYEGQDAVGRLVIDNAEDEDFEEFWKIYLDLERDYATIKNQLCMDDQVMGKAVAHGHGIRILKQEKWETLVSFLISQNNNIGRIKGCIATLCQAFGQPAGSYRGKEYYRMPSPEVLSALSERDLACCGLGYRAKYLIDAAKQVCQDGMETLFRMGEADEQEALSYLTSLSGVGPKVANCVMLFSMDKLGSFPIDVWIKQAMSTLYGFDKKDVKGMEIHARERFAPYGGIAQQYLFYYIRGGGNGAC